MQRLESLFLLHGNFTLNFLFKKEWGRKGKEGEAAGHRHLHFANEVSGRLSSGVGPSVWNA